MKIKRVAAAIVALAAMASMCLCLAACGPTGSKDVELTPTVDDSLLVKPKTLTVGINSSFAPFGGVSNGQIVGVDVDVAAALASQLGLELNVVDISGENATDMLAEKKIDIAMSESGVQPAGGTVTMVGPYIENGPALFGMSDTATGMVDTASLSGVKIGAYKGSIAANAAAQYCGAENIVGYTSLSDAFDALNSGEVKYVASDAVAGGYLTLSYPGVNYMGSLQAPQGCYIGVLNTSTALATAVSDALKTIDENGVLSTVVSKWVGLQTAKFVVPAVVEIGIHEPPAPEPEEEEGEEGDEGEAEEYE